MKILTKNNYKFVAGMFWQIPDEGSRTLNLSKLVRDTKHNMFCQIKRINPTWGFCQKSELQGERKVASLGKFIIETSGLSAIYANSIICYKFKDAGEIDEGKELKADLYGYIVLLNGTICPNDGEYVAEFDAVKESILGQCKRHEIETLYLPSDVSGKFFGIYELLDDAFNNPKLLLHLLQNLTRGQRASFGEFVKSTFNLVGNNGDNVNNDSTGGSSRNNRYLKLLNNMGDMAPDVVITLLKRLIKEPAFEEKLKTTREKNIKYLVPNVYVIAFTSDEIYWQHPKFKANFNKSLIKSVASTTNKKYKIITILLLLGLSTYLGYDYVMGKDIIPIHKSVVKAPPVPVAKAVLPQDLIATCLSSNDRFFGNVGTWTLTQMECNSLGAKFTFAADTDTTLANFTGLIGESKNIMLNGKTGIYTQKFTSNKFKLAADALVKESQTLEKIKKLTKEQITSNLEQAAINYRFRLSISSSNKGGVGAVKFTINSELSPLFMLNHGILANVKLIKISMNFDKTSGFYRWTIEGEY